MRTKFFLSDIILRELSPMLGDDYYGTTACLLTCF